MAACRRPVLVFPAYAGMSPTTETAALICARFPRLRGDEPAMLPTYTTLPPFSPPTRG